VLRRPRIGREENFFELGGHSLLATQVISRIRSVFATELPLRAIFGSPTVAGLAKRIEELQAEYVSEGSRVEVHPGQGTEQMLSAIESLSEAEVEALLKTINQPN
jgi:acyl carrier protein